MWGMAMHLSKVRTKEGYSNLKKFYRYATAHIPGGDTIYKFTHRVKERLKHKSGPGTMFEHMGLDYLGPVDGHDLPELLQVLRTAKEMNKPVLVHVMTHKGHGFEPAENDPAKFHGVGILNPVDGHGLGAKKQTFSDAFGQTALELAREDPRVCRHHSSHACGTALRTSRKNSRIGCMMWVLQRNTPCPWQVVLPSRGRSPLWPSTPPSSSVRMTRSFRILHFWDCMCAVR